jgi:hypothetical protein
MPRFSFLLFAFATASLIHVAPAQTPAGDIHVSVVLNSDGSRTTYETDLPNRKSVATTAERDGKVREKIRYELDENGRFLRSDVFGPKDQFRFSAKYRYDANNRLVEETHFAKNETVLGRLVFRYDANGHQIGYSAYDGAGKLLGQTSAAATASPSKRH